MNTTTNWSKYVLQTRFMRSIKVVGALVSPKQQIQSAYSEFKKRLLGCPPLECDLVIVEYEVYLREGYSFAHLTKESIDSSCLTPCSLWIIVSYHLSFFHK